MEGLIDGRRAFKEELDRRGLSVTYDSATDRFRVGLPNGSVLVSIANLQKDLAIDGDISRVARFVDAVEESARRRHCPVARRSLYWTLEPNDYVEKAEFRFPVSDCVDRVLVSLAENQGMITWVSQKMLDDTGFSEDSAFQAGFENLDAALVESKLEFKLIGEVRLAFVSASIPMKSSLILAPGFRRFVSDTIGWPVMAVAPDRDFLYFWAARHEDFVGRVGRTVVKEYSTSSYPISTEVYLISDDGVKAVGAFPKQD